MNDVRDEAIGALLERAAVGIESTRVDRLPEVIRHGSRRRTIRFTAIATAVGVFVGAVSWAGLQNEGRGRIPADIADWDTFASLEENGWTVQVPPTWRVQELPACPNAPERIGVIVTNTDFEFLNPQGESPQCEDRFVFHGFPSDGVVLAFMPRGIIPGLFWSLPDTAFPLSPDLLMVSGGIRGGPAESNQSIWLRHEPLGVLRRWVGPHASAADVEALDRMLASLRVRGAPRWVEKGIDVGSLTVRISRPDTWMVTASGLPVVIDAPSPVLQLTSPRVGAGACRPLPWASWNRIGGFGEYGVAIVVSDASGSWGSPALDPRPRVFRFQDSLEETESCQGKVRALRFGFEEAGRPFYLEVAASTAVYREEPEMLRYILNSIRIEEA